MKPTRPQNRHHSMVGGMYILYDINIPVGFSAQILSMNCQYTAFPANFQVEGPYAELNVNG